MNSDDGDALKGVEQLIILEDYGRRGQISFKNYFSMVPINSAKLQ